MIRRFSHPNTTLLTPEVEIQRRSGHVEAQVFLQGGLRYGHGKKYQKVTPWSPYCDCIILQEKQMNKKKNWSLDSLIVLFHTVSFGFERFSWKLLSEKPLLVICKWAEIVIWKMDYTGQQLMLVLASNLLTSYGKCDDQQWYSKLIILDKQLHNITMKYALTLLFKFIL